MGLAEWADNARYYYDHRGVLGGTRLTLGEFASGAVRRIYPRLPNPGVPPYERDWDALIVLDACRVDALQAVADEYDFLPATIPAITSVGTNSAEWLRHTFADRYRAEMARTAYVTFNPHSDALDPVDFLHLDEVWRHAWDADRGGVPPRPVTDGAVWAGREFGGELDRLIVHYKPPHAPYPELDGFDPTNRIDDHANDRSGVFGAIIEGRLSRAEAWAGYLDHLRSGLDDVALLLENLDADRAVITADHGECFGEWGLYGHHRSTPVPELLRVPWVETGAVDHGEHEPNPERSDHDSGQSIDEKLRALGYR